MDQTEKVIVRLTPDTIVILQALVDRGYYSSLSESVSDAVQKMIESRLTHKEVSKILKDYVKDKPVDMKSLLTDGEPVSMDEAISKAVAEYVRSRMKPEE
ncbi:MAG: hypothetical protein LBR42_00785 [Candidatus Methanoplasma sp.]|jgi:Arc/MetJ-type ribon-helix-helix transcriptional regulator|nr:hypothetical protein [Candidatus Methanoplasma sp.]